MPTISCYHRDMERLFGQKIEVSRWREFLDKAKSDFKDYNEETGEMRIEIVDTNRPDLWSAEGICRQLRSSLLNKKSSYPFFSSTPKEKERIIVDVNLMGIRPYIGGFLAFNIDVDEFLLEQLIQTQEKLCENYGRSRELIAIGVYDGSRIVLPIHYKAFSPDGIKFVPLGGDEEITLQEILDKHPKGQEYGSIVRKFPLYPLITDDNGKVLSFPPIINSEDLGKVVAGNKCLFVEVTGTELSSVILTTNILACNLCDRGAQISPFMVEYSHEYEKTSEMPASGCVITPQDLRQVVSLKHDYLEKMAGEKIDFSSVIKHLTSMDFSVSPSEDGKEFICHAPPYRQDCLHPVDLIEDFSIGRGYNTFLPQMPEKYTVGSIAPIIEFADTLRMLMIGMGFQEFITYVLTSRDKVFDKINRPQKSVVEVENVMSDNFSVLRPSLLPVLIEIEAKNLRVEFPHRIFEEGEVVVFSPEENLGSKTLHNLAALISHSSASFSEIHSCLHSLMFYLNIPYKLVETSDPAFIDGRAGKIFCFDREVGLIGEIHPQVLENWGIVVPCAGFEITLDYLCNKL